MVIFLINLGYDYYLVSKNSFLIFQKYSHGCQEDLLLDAEINFILLFSIYYVIKYYNIDYINVKFIYICNILVQQTN